jgi:DNA mismatch repair protein MutS
VARLAGLSERVLERAGRIMDRLQERSKELYSSLPGTSALPGTGEPSASTESVKNEAETVFVSRFLKDIAALDLNNMTPMEALRKIQSWKEFFASSGIKGREGNGLRRRAAQDGKESPGLFDSL